MNKIKISRGWLILLVPVLIVVNAGFLRPNDDYFEISKNLDIFGKMYREVHQSYVDEVDPGKFMRTGIDAMLESLDPYTNYISASEVEDFRFMSTGQYGGIGAMVSTRPDKVMITEPYEDYPAAKAGLRAGDIIIKIDDEVIEGKDMTQTDVRSLLRGQPNTDVRITVRREGAAQPIEAVVTREDIKIKNVPYYGMINGNTGYISLTGFTNNASQEVGAALAELKGKGAERIVLDLRGNPGGLLYEAINISNIFVSKGETIVETRGKSEGSLKIYRASNSPLDMDIPMAVIINRGSASASEIVSGVMQDLDRAVIVGQRSYGKGLVQTTKPLSYNAQLKITTAKYYTPSGRCIQAINYAERNDDGSVARIPDSLRKAFTTRNGRTVYDGGGINPDVEVALPEYHTVTRELVRQGLIFDYATRFRSENETIDGAREFRITDDIYKDFVAYVEGRDFSFETKTEREFVRLQSLMEEEAYKDDLQEELDKMEEIIRTEKGRDLTTYREEISKLLISEIVARYYYKRGEIEAGFDMDPDVLEALKVLDNPNKYRSILRAKK